MTPFRFGPRSGESRRVALAVSLLLATAIHACVLFFVRFREEPAPGRERLLWLTRLAPAEPVAEAPPPAAAARPPPRAREPKRPAPPRSVAASLPALAPPVAAPVAEAPQAAAAGSLPAPRVRAAVSAQPRYRLNPQPSYPAIARRRRQEGVVLLSVRVGARGEPEAVEIQTSSGFAALDEAAVAAVERWEFEPARQDGEPVPSQVEVPIRFELERD